MPKSNLSALHRESTVALLTYKAATAEQDLGAARDRLTGAFLDAYTQLINGVVIPEAKRENMSASADVLGAASVLAEPGHAVVLVMVNQTTTVAAQKADHDSLKRQGDLGQGGRSLADLRVRSRLIWKIHGAGDDEQAAGLMSKLRQCDYGH